MAIPKVFISYSHDSQEHKKWVLDLATRLRNTGVDANIDQWDLRPGDDLPAFMEKHLAQADRILMICTDRYVEKANLGHGGVGYEKMIITADLLKHIDSNKVIPLIRQAGTHHVPTFLKSKLYLDFSDSSDFEFSFDELVRAIHNAPLFVKPPVGNNPFTPVKDSQQEHTGDAIKEMMKYVVRDYESGEDYSEEQSINAQMSISRILFDMLVARAVREKLVTRDSDGWIYLTDKGRMYAIEHKLVST